MAHPFSSWPTIMVLLPYTWALRDYIFDELAGRLGEFHTYCGTRRPLSGLFASHAGSAAFILLGLQFMFLVLRSFYNAIVSNLLVKYGLGQAPR